MTSEGFPLLDRLVEFDERSRNYPIRQLLAAEPRPPRSYTWRCTPTLDQGREGACVGFAWAHEAAARPVVIPGVDEAGAFALYRLAQTLDQWPGEAYQGTSVLAGAKAATQLSQLFEYRWAFGLADTLEAISYRGPAVLGVNWYEGMFRPYDDGFLRPSGAAVGGHAILAKGVSVKRQAVLLHNSWGAGWGSNGEAWLSFEDLGRLLAEDGEACIPVRRRAD